MATLIETKERLNVVSDTKKITQSLQLVAASRMKSFQNKAMASIAFSEKISGLLHKVSTPELRARIFTIHADGPVLFVLMSSHKGLCGSLNTKLAKTLFSSHEWSSREGNRLLVTLGKKSLESARMAGVTPLHSFQSIGEQLSLLESFDIVSQLFNLWETNQCSQLYLVYPEYISAFEYRTVLKKFLPFPEDTPPTDSALDPSATHTFDEPYEKFLINETILLEPSPTHVIRTLAYQTLAMKITASFYALKAVEYSSRMISMKKATDAATDMIELLTLEYNKTRQAAITQELSELAGARSARHKKLLQDID